MNTTKIGRMKMEDMGLGKAKTINTSPVSIKARCPACSKERKFICVINTDGKGVKCECQVCKQKWE